MPIQVDIVPILEDNYVFIIQSKNDIAIIDPGDAFPVMSFLKQKNIIPTCIFNTHHHNDHINGNYDLFLAFEIDIYCSKYDKKRITSANKVFETSKKYTFGDSYFTIEDTPGHTNGHIIIHFPEEKILFCGDTLFSLGCGKIFEGSPEKLFHSLLKIRQFENDTLVYCTHEYTLKNSKFALANDPNNHNLSLFCENIKALRKRGQPTIPFNLGMQKKCNLFLRTDDAQLQDHHQEKDPLKLFTKLRELRDQF